MFRLAVLLCVLSAPVMAAKVLVIESYHAQFGWDEGYRAGLTSVLAPQHQLIFFEMDTKRLPTSQYDGRAQRAYEVYQREQPDLVILGDDNALNYMLPKLYNDPISIVFLGVNANPRELIVQYSGKAGVTGVLERPFFTKTMASVGALLVNVKPNPKILVLFDSGTTSKIATRYMESQSETLKDNLHIETEIAMYSTERAWHDSVLNAKKNGVDAIVVGLYQTLIDHEGKNAPAEQVMEWTSQYSPVPVFGFWDFSIGKGKGVGGVVLFGEAQGKQAGRMANDILQKGLDASTMPIQIGNQGQEVYSSYEMERWALTPPKGWQPID